ncbi:hypothetical protein BO79DRAFT_259578 [Aspergillus costaricaensis CBS 115574]|uniref:Uncharacterized protein n=1 Tax=Aspergillus costaricaensis CBS 115574 TaxID=1448317 RepID=A0ACD1I1M2_9EURO|nr:hypothetical protein BO79DRAFT_259578 [Aspergillus costaricaensis CBS 115574]RAK84155.1 hypothetical protein BO79DRAFT_259578 [Aspergillus costaricaensis CBS 115574]
MSNLPDIRDEILKINAKRIIIRMKSEGSEDCRTTAYRIVGEVFPDWKQDNRILFLAIQDQTVLPVYVLRRQRGNWHLIRWPQEDRSVAVQLAELHRVTGYGAEIPFYENHNSRVVHANPREYLK